MIYKIAFFSKSSDPSESCFSVLLDQKGVQELQIKKNKAIQSTLHEMIKKYVDFDEASFHFLMTMRVEINDWKIILKSIPSWSRGETNSVWTWPMRFEAAKWQYMKANLTSIKKDTWQNVLMFRHYFCKKLLKLSTLRLRKSLPRFRKWSCTSARFHEDSLSRSVWNLK